MAGITNQPNVRSSAPLKPTAAAGAGPAPAPAAAATGQPALSALGKAVMKNPTTGNAVTFHVSPEESKQAVLESIRNAKSSFYIETFIWHNDRAGNEIADALIARKKEAEAKGQSFDIKIMIDWLGLNSGSGGSGDNAIVKKLQDAGIDVRVFSKGYVDVKEMKVSPITHRKLYIADGSEFTTGGRNIGDEYLSKTFGKDNAPSWHDLLYTVKGEETGRVIKEFFRNWVRVGGKVPAELPKTEPVAGANVPIQSVTTNPIDGGKGLREAHSTAIANAKKEIVLIYPYLSDDKLIDQVVAAKKANPNLRVRVILPASKEAGHEGSIYSSLNMVSAQQLMAVGAEVRMYGSFKDEKGKAIELFSHMKGMVIDGEVLSIGSGNGDERTYDNNHELNTLIADKATVQRYMSQVVEPDWKSAAPLTADEAKPKSFFERIKRKVLEWFDFLL